MASWCWPPARGRAGCRSCRPTLANVAVLRDAADALRLRGLLAPPAVTVLGGGFIGLEIAATARALGKHVTVLEVGAAAAGLALGVARTRRARAGHAPRQRHRPAPGREGRRFEHRGRTGRPR
jgi:NADPH-dependent 2,4-dienoyl-CoA reductase/sulfur reductase-like enzyme